MILRYSRLTSVFFIAVSLGVGIPLTWALSTNPSLSESGLRWVCWAFVSLGALVFVRGVQLLVAPPVVLALTLEGIQIHYNARNGGFTKDSDLLPWRLIDGMQLKSVRGEPRRTMWTIEFALSSPPPFDVDKRDGIRQRSYSQDPNLHRFYIIASGFFNISKEDLLAALQSGLHQWQTEHGLHLTQGAVDRPQTASSGALALFKGRNSLYLLAPIIMILALTILRMQNKAPTYRPGGPYYYRYSQKGILPYQPMGEITEKEAKDKEQNGRAYYVAFFTNDCRILSFERKQLGAAPWKISYIYENGTITKEEVTNAQGTKLFDLKEKYGRPKLPAEQTR